MALRRILLIGDSIRMGYMPFVQKKLEGQADVQGPQINGGDTRRHVALSEEWLADHPTDVIHFNAGLHDLKIPRDADPADPATRQVPLDEYVSNLETTLKRMKATKAKLIWASTTPVIFEWHHEKKDFDRRNEDVDAYNQAAKTLMDREGVAINDLHAVIAGADIKKLMTPDGVHYTPAGYELLGDAVCQAVMA